MGNMIFTKELCRSRHITPIIAIAAKLHPKLLYLRPRFKLHPKLRYLRPRFKTSFNDYICVARKELTYDFQHPLN